MFQNSENNSKYLFHRNTLINLIRRLLVLDLGVFLYIIDDLTGKIYQHESGKFVAEFMDICTYEKNLDRTMVKN